MYATLELPLSSRKPRVGPGWSTRSAKSEMPSARHGSAGKSWKLTRAGTSRKSSGKSGGEKERRMRSRNPNTCERGPQISSVTRASQSGAKKRSPSRWSRWRCVRKRWIRRVPRRARSRPSARMPVPASRMRAVSSSRSTSTHEVLPPWASVSCPGTGTEPRHPQIFSCSGTPLVAPEERDDADELVHVRKKWKRRHVDPAFHAVGARHQIPKVRGAAVCERDVGGTLLARERFSCGRPRRELGEPVVERHLADLREPLAEDGLCRLVIEDEAATRVGDQRRRREVRDELAGEDQDELLLALALHEVSPHATLQAPCQRSASLPPMAIREGACHCGQLRLEVSGDPF